MTRLAAAREISLDRPVTFTFDGKTYQGYEGDTLASALAANGVDVLSRSFKRHRPRGLFSLGIDDTGAGMVRFFGSIFFGSVVMAIYVGFIRPNAVSYTHLTLPTKA